MKILTLFIIFIPTIIFSNSFIEYEYWINKDYANKKIDSVESSSSEFVVMDNFDVSNSQTNVNIFNIRFRDTSGKWSVVISKLFIKDTSLQFVGIGSNKLVTYEYWLDNDYTNKKVIQILANDNNMLFFDSIATSDLIERVHSVNYRFKDSLGNWSIVQSRLFINGNNNEYVETIDTNNHLKSYRWWFNSDLNKMYFADIDNSKFTFDSLLSLNHPKLDTNQLNFINVQFLDSIGRWSVVISDTFLLENYKAPKPILKSPSSNSLVNKDSIVKWYPISFVNKFSLQIASDSLFNDIIIEIDSLDEIEYRFSLQAGTTYFWRVKSYYEDTESDWSETRKFTTKEDILPPNLISVSNNSKYNSLDIDLIWSSSISASNYIFELSKNSNFDTIYFQKLLADTVINCQEMNLDFITKYFWRVKAVSSADTSQYSNIWNFTTIYSYEIVLDTIIVNNTNSINLLGSYNISDENEIIKKGFCLSKNNNPSIADTLIEVSNDTLIAEFDNLDYETRYYVRAFLKTNNDTHYSQEKYVDIGHLLKIMINQRWNLISANVTSFQDSIQNLFASIKDSILIFKDSKGKVFVPSYDINQINMLSYRQAYLIYSNYDIEFEISGFLPDSANSYVDLKSGWNWFPYLKANAEDVTVTLGELVDLNKLLIIKDLQGKVFIPSYNINTLGKLEPGKGYYLYSLDNYKFYFDK